ncbi:DNA methyltransferase [Mycoplasmopsis glycophila]|uniref:DNA methyltransferase n=1 Tax=Mycoplasmopsis glycophila TaxID=171285 RepID=UPI001F447387|nr:site-specific DNA-methyltransferase [Mycoplasmopsis glycophila]
MANDKENVLASKFIYRDKFSRNGWLNMISERLMKARTILKEDGVIFVSIDDAEQAYLKVLMDEIFGEENFVANLSWIKKKGPGGNASNKKKIVKNCEYILVYTKNIEKIMFNYKIHDEEKLKKLGYVHKDEYFNQRGYYKLTDLHRPSSTGSFQYTESLDYLIKAPDGTDFQLYANIIKPKSARYTWGKDTFDKGNELGFIFIDKNSQGYWQAYRKQYQFVKFDPKSKKIINESAGQEYESYITEIELIKENNYVKEDIYSQHGGAEIIDILNDKNSFDFPKPVELIKYLLKMRTNKKCSCSWFFCRFWNNCSCCLRFK